MHELLFIYTERVNLTPPHMFQSPSDGRPENGLLVIETRGEMLI